MTPSLSPKKTWEGALGSVAGSLLAAGALLGLSELFEMWNSSLLSYRDEEVWYWLVMAVVVNWPRRWAIWPSPRSNARWASRTPATLLPGHGGVLDRIDALLLAAPVLWYAQVIHQRF